MGWVSDVTAAQGSCTILYGLSAHAEEAYTKALVSCSDCPFEGFS